MERERNETLHRCCCTCRKANPKVCQLICYGARKGICNENDTPDCMAAIRMKCEGYKA